MKRPILIVLLCGFALVVGTGAYAQDRAYGFYVQTYFEIFHVTWQRDDVTVTRLALDESLDVITFGRSPDGEWLVVMGTSQEGLTIYVTTADGTFMRELTNYGIGQGPSPGYFTQLDWSADDMIFLSVDYFVGQDEGIYTINPEAEVPELAFLIGGFLPSGASDGRRLVYEDSIIVENVLFDPWTRWTVKLLDMDAPVVLEPISITSDLQGDCRNADWQPGGEHIVYRCGGRRYVTNVETAETIRLPESPETGHCMRWSDDGQFIALTTWTGIQVLEMATGEYTLLPYPEVINPYVVCIAWG